MVTNENIVNSIKLIHLKKIKTSRQINDQFFCTDLANQLIVKTIHAFNNKRSLSLKKVFQLVTNSREDLNHEKINQLDEKYHIKKILYMLEECEIITKQNEQKSVWYDTTWTFHPYQWYEKFNETKKWVLDDIDKKRKIIKKTKILFKCSQSCTREVYIYSKKSYYEDSGRCANGHKLVPIRKSDYTYLDKEYEQFEKITFPQSFVEEKPIDIPEKTVTPEVEIEENIEVLPQDLSKPIPIEIPEYVDIDHIYSESYISYMNMWNRNIQFINQYKDIIDAKNNTNTKETCTMMRKRSDIEVIKDLIIQYWREIIEECVTGNNKDLSTVLNSVSSSKKHVWIVLKDKLPLYGIARKKTEFYKDIDNLKINSNGDEFDDEAILIYQFRHLRLGPKGIDQYLRYLLLNGEDIPLSELDSKLKMPMKKGTNIIDLIKQSKQTDSFSLPKEEYPHIIPDTKEAQDFHKKGEKKENMNILHDEHPIVNDHELKAKYNALYPTKLTHRNGKETKSFKKFKVRHTMYQQLKDDGTVAKIQNDSTLSMDEKLEKLYGCMYPQKHVRVSGEKTKNFIIFEKEYNHHMETPLKNETKKSLPVKSTHDEHMIITLFKAKYPDKKLSWRGNETKDLITFRKKIHDGKETIDHIIANLNDEERMRKVFCEMYPEKKMLWKGEETNTFTDFKNKYKKEDYEEQVREQKEIVTEKDVRDTEPESEIEKEQKEKIATVSLPENNVENVQMEHFIGMCIKIKNKLLENEKTIVFNAQQFLEEAEKHYPNFAKAFFKLFMDYSPLPNMLKIKDRTVTYVMENRSMQKQHDNEIPVEAKISQKQNEYRERVEK